MEEIRGGPGSHIGSLEVEGEEEEGDLEDQDPLLSDDPQLGQCSEAESGVESHYSRGQ